MPVHVVGSSLMTSDLTPHEARSVGDDGWVVSYLPGRTLTTEQATAAIQAAEVVTTMRDLAKQIGLTALEAVGMALQEPPWEVGTLRRRSAAFRGRR
jgi:hypothetical protein